MATNPWHSLLFSCSVLLPCTVVKALWEPEAAGGLPSLALSLPFASLSGSRFLFAPFEFNFDPQQTLTCVIKELDCNRFKKETEISIPTMKQREIVLSEFNFGKNFFLSWRIVDLQCCVSFRRTAKWFSYIYVYIYIYIFFFRFFSIIVYYKILNTVPCAMQ